MNQTAPVRPILSETALIRRVYSAILEQIASLSLEHQQLHLLHVFNLPGFYGDYRTVVQRCLLSLSNFPHQCFTVLRLSFHPAEFNMPSNAPSSPICKHLKSSCITCGSPLLLKEGLCSTGHATRINTLRLVSVNTWIVIQLVQSVFLGCNSP